MRGAEYPPSWPMDDAKHDRQGPKVVAAENDGNFRHLLRYRVQWGDLRLQGLLITAPGNVKYAS